MHEEHQQGPARHRPQQLVHEHKKVRRSNQKQGTNDAHTSQQGIPGVNRTTSMEHGVPTTETGVPGDGGSSQPESTSVHGFKETEEFLLTSLSYMHEALQLMSAESKKDYCLRVCGQPGVERRSICIQEMLPLTLRKKDSSSLGYNLLKRSG
jgi:hypothetical protein